MKLKTKLLLSFGAVACTTLAVGLISKIGMAKTLDEVHATSERINERRAFLADSIDLARGAQVAFKIQVQEWKNVLIRGNDPAQYDKYLAGFNKREAETQALLSQLEDLLSTNNVPDELVVETTAEHAALGVKYRDAVAQFDKEDPNAGKVVDKLVKGIDRAPTQKMDEVVDFVKAFEEDSSQDDEAALVALQAKIGIATTAVIAGGVLLAIVLGVWLSSSISKRIQVATESLSVATTHVSEASSQIDVSTQALANGATEQAASIEETGASLTELSSMTHRNAEHAATAKELAAETRGAAETGSKDMSAMVDAITEIKAASDNIGNIIKTVDEIAFQTNILALNAAVEAARAGEAGAGFAVVADEVRNLAQRSAQAATETTRLIQDNIEKSEHGVVMSNKVVEGLSHILEQARKVDQLVGEIASASKEQSNGLEHISTAISQMESVTQHNAATAEETASASNEVRSQMKSLVAAAESLNELVGKVRKQASKSGKSVAAKAISSPAPAKAAPATIASPQHASRTPVASAKSASDDDSFLDF